MQAQKYSVNQHLIETLLAWVKSGEIAIPEIQRPFVWDSTKVRDLLDSLYQGYPIGYIIAWRNPNVRLKDGTVSEGKKVLIDGQQRVTALTAAILNQSVVNKNYQKINITIAFHPQTERFEVVNPAIKKDAAWIQDVAPVINGEESVFRLVREYCARNPDADEERIAATLERLRSILKKQVGLIELDADLDIETVTEVFIRINSKGVVLSQADFAMSKIASNAIYGGNSLRKCIDYFCRLAVAPEFYEQIAAGDKDFAATEYLPKIAWLRSESDDLYDPSYTDLLRVAFTSEFNRGKLSDLVSLLSGRNFERRTYEEDIARESFARLKRGVLNFVNETNFKRFVMIVKSAGFVDASLIGSQNALNFAYIVYLKMRASRTNDARIESVVRRWIVFALLTARFSGSSESTFDYDVRQIAEGDAGSYLQQLERAELSDGFWNVGLPQQLASSNVNMPAFNVYLAALCKTNAKGFLSRDITVKDMIEHRGDIHHLFPRDYLKKQGFGKAQYNQVANFVYTQTEINVKIGNKPPNVYFGELTEQCRTKELKYGGICDFDLLQQNLVENDIPAAILTATADDYSEFLAERRLLIADRLRHYYESL